MSELALRPGGLDDAGWLLGLFDEAVAWMVARGRPGRWGSEPFSARESARARVAEMCAGGGLRVGAADGEDVAALVVGQRAPHVAAIDATELHVELLLVSRRHVDEARGCQRDGTSTVDGDWVGQVFRRELGQV